jgi:uncharacterized protein YecE (DUF72 family)
MSRALNTLLAACAVGVVVTSSAPAAVPADRFPPTTDVAGRTLHVRGTGLLSRWMIKGCDMALYVPRDTPRGRILTDVPRCLEFHYYRTIRADQFAAAAWDTLRRNYSDAELEKLKPKIDRLHDVYRDVAKGDRYRLVYVPETGTTLYLNGEALGTVEGEEFASAYFSVWLGPEPLDRRLKRELMGDE